MDHSLATSLFSTFELLRTAEKGGEKDGTNEENSISLFERYFPMLGALTFYSNRWTETKYVLFINWESHVIVVWFIYLFFFAFIFLFIFFRIIFLRFFISFHFIFFFNSDYCYFFFQLFSSHRNMWWQWACSPTSFC